MEPTGDRFWKAVSEILSTCVRLDLPKAMDPMDEPDVEIEAALRSGGSTRPCARAHAKSLEMTSAVGLMESVFYIGVRRSRCQNGCV